MPHRTAAPPLPPAEWTPLWPDYVRWHALAVATGDYNPVLPVLSGVARLARWNTEDCLWACLVQAAYGHVGSTLKVLSHCPRPVLPPEPWLNLPRRRGQQRPALRALFGLVADAACRHGGLLPWLAHHATDVPEWMLPDVVGARLRSLPGLRGAAAHQLRHLIAAIVGARVPGLVRLAPDGMDHAHAAGPRAGLALLRTGLPTGTHRHALAAVDLVSTELVGRLRLAGLWAPPGVAAATLTSYHALAGGHYYLGEAIDVMHAQLTAVPSLLAGLARAARAQTLPHHYLGEMNGWTGVCRERRPLYAQRRRIAERAEPTDRARATA